MRKSNVAEKHAVHAVKQVELLNYLLNNLQQFNLKPTTKLVLLYLAGCYNQKHADVFPKQKTIALQMGISERSVISAIQELHREGLVISERKYTNRYRFTSKVLNLGAQEEGFSEPEEIADTNCKNCTSEGENFAPPYNRTIIEQEKEQTEVNKLGGNVYLFQSEEDRILEEYAKPRAKKSVAAYIAKLKRDGSATKIISDYKKKVQSKEARSKAIDAYHENRRAEDAKLAKTAQDPWDNEAMLNFAKKHGLKKEPTYKNYRQAVCTDITSS